MDPTRLVLIFLVTKPIFLLCVIWIVLWRHRHKVTAEMLPYPQRRRPAALDAPTEHERSLE